MALLIALLSGATAAMIAGRLRRAPRWGWLVDAGLGTAGGAAAFSMIHVAPAPDSDMSYLLLIVALSALCGVVILWALGAIARLLRR